MVLMAICDARYVFPFVDIGGSGSNNDSWVFRKSAIGKWFFNKEMNLPNPENIENPHVFGQIPYYLVGDDVFPLQQFIDTSQVSQNFIPLILAYLTLTIK